MLKNSDRSIGIVTTARSWPLTAVAIFFVLQGLAAGYNALYFASFGGLQASLASVSDAAIYAVFGVMLIVAGVGILARLRACLTVGAVLAALSLAGAGISIAEAIFRGAAPWQIAADAVFIAAYWLQYIILRSRSTSALFAKS